MLEENIEEINKVEEEIKKINKECKNDKSLLINKLDKIIFQSIIGVVANFNTLDILRSDLITNINTLLIFRKAIVNNYSNNSSNCNND